MGLSPCCLRVWGFITVLFFWLDSLITSPLTQILLIRTVYCECDTKGPTMDNWVLVFSPSWVWITSVLSYCIYSSWFFRFMIYIYIMLSLGQGDKKPKKAHWNPWTQFFWLPHSPSAQCRLAYDTFIIIKCNVSVSHTKANQAGLSH